MKFKPVAIRFVLPAMLALTVGSSDAAPAAAAVVLTATVGPTAVITLKKGSVKVTTLPAGQYTINVSDKSASHNFHLKGPNGFTKMTTVKQIVNKTWNVTLTKGTYIYQCDPHASLGMKGSFKIM